ncbi:MAG: hypothetical protein J6K32_02555 [Clostridia bacterium]|nr:hypothetical protein [Clostridia bacterium]
MANTRTEKNTRETQRVTSRDTSQSRSDSLTRNVLDEDLLARLLSGLSPQMDDDALAQYARSLLEPQKNAGLEAAQQTYEATRLAKEQEIAALAASLQQAVGQQNAAYRRSIADVETAALARGMGRSSYTMQTLAGQGDALAAAVRSLTDDTARQQQAAQAQITQAARHNAQTQARVNTDYAASLAAKIEELRQSQRAEYNRNYLTAVSTALGRQTTGSQTDQRTGDQTTTRDGSEITETRDILPPPQGDNNGGGGGGGGTVTKKKKTTPTPPANPRLYTKQRLAIS